MDKDVQFYIQSAHASSTKRSYTCSNTRYLDFCNKSGFSYPYPTTEHCLCQFAAYLARQNLRHQTIKCYLSGIRYYHIIQSYPDPFKQDMPKLQFVLRGIKSDQAKQSLQPRPRLPVTPTILSQVHKVWAQSPTEFNHIMLWAASTLCFFGFLRSGEITLTSTTNYDPSAHLSYDDISVDNATKPSIIQVRLKTSKTDPFRQGVSIYIGKTGNQLCPVMALLNYLVLRGNSPGPFFQFQDCTPLTKARFVSGFRSALTRAGIQAHLYSGQFQRWCSHNSSFPRYRRFHNTNTWTLEKLSIPDIHPHSTRELSSSIKQHC